MADPMSLTAPGFDYTDQIPSAAPRERRERRMDDDEFQGIVQAAVKDAVDYIDSSVQPSRTMATAYYRGDLFGNEEEGRSQVVMTEVRDVVLAMMPSLLRIFTSSENPVEFQPTNDQTVDVAEQATEYVSHVYNVDNPGFSLTYNAIKDALISKIGVFKWWTETTEDILENSYSGIDAMQVAVMQTEPGVEIKSMEPSERAVDEVPASGPGGAPGFFDIKVRRTTRKTRQVVQTVPPEEFLIARNARDLESADFAGHRSLKTLSELVEMGFDADEITENGGTSSSFDMNTEAQERNQALNTLGKGNGTNPDKTMSRYLYIEAWMRVDRDMDGIAELRRVCILGDNAHVLFDELADGVPMAVLCPDPQPHMVIGSSMADQIMDLQLIKSNIVRNTLDSLAQTIHPRTGVVEGKANMDDVLNNENGGVIRMTEPGMVIPFTVPFVGQQALPMISYLDDIGAKRTGITKASQGLDPDVLQSTTKDAVTATMSAAAERIEMVARIFAETGFKRLFSGLLKEIVKHQDQPRMIRLRGKWTRVDPRYWDAEMDVMVNVGLGNGNVQERTALLMQVAAKQEQLLTTLGPSNPLTDAKQYRDTMVRILEINGIREGARYFKPISTADVQKYAAQAQAQKPAADPAMMVAQAEVAKTQADARISAAKAQIEARKAIADNDLAHQKMLADTWLRAAELEMKYNSQLQVAHLDAITQHVQGEATRSSDMMTQLATAHMGNQSAEAQHEKQLLADAAMQRAQPQPPEAPA